MNKLLVLTSSFPKNNNDYDGSFVKQLSSRLCKDFDVHVLTPYTSDSLSYEKMGPLKVHRYKYWCGKDLLGEGEIMANLKRNKLFYLQIVPFFLFQLLAIREIVKKNSVRIIHAHWLIPQAFLAVIYKKLFNKKIKIIATIHGGDINNFKALLGGRVLKFILKNIDDLTVVSHAIKKDVLNLGYKKEIYVYPMGVDTNLFSPDRKNIAIKKKLDVEAIFILFVGGVIHRKGIHHLINAMPEIVNHHKDAKLVVVGDGSLMPEMKELVKKLRLLNNVIFTGKIPNEALPEYFATCDVFVLPSNSEGFGLVYAEAMSCGAVALGADLPPVHDIIKDKETGFFLQENTPICISKNICSILNNLEQFGGLKTKARNHIVNNFDWDIVANNYSKLLSKTLYV